MQGDAPARVTNWPTANMARRAVELERNAEAVYSKARILKLPTGELDGRAVLELDAATQRASARRRRPASPAAQQQVVRAAFSPDIPARLTNGQVVDNPASSDAPKADTVGATAEPVPKQYEDAVADYMRFRIAGEPAKASEAEYARGNLA